MTLRQQRYTAKNGERRKSRKYYADFYDHGGVRRALALFPDKKNATEAARAVQRLVHVRASGEMIPPELHRFIANTKPVIRQKLADWGIIDPARVAAVT